MSYRISSNYTLFLRLLLPTLLTVFLGSFAIAFFLADPGDLPILYVPYFKWGFLITYFVLLAILLFTTMRLYRVEVDEANFYVTNYFKTARYPIESIESIKKRNLLLGHVHSIRLHERGIFGRKIRFLVARPRLQDYIEEHPDSFWAQN